MAEAQAERLELELRQLRLEKELRWLAHEGELATKASEWEQVCEDHQPSGIALLSTTPVDTNGESLVNLSAVSLEHMYLFAASDGERSLEGELGASIVEDAQVSPRLCLPLPHDTLIPTSLYRIYPSIRPSPVPQYRTIWSELGMRQDAYPMTAPVDDLLADDLAERVFGLDSFYVHEVEITPIGALFRGAMRRDAAIVSERVQRQLRTHADLAEQEQLFLVSDPTSAGSERLSDSEWDDDEEELFDPVFLALPASMQPPAAAALLPARAGEQSRSATWRLWSARLSPLACGLLTTGSSLAFGYACYAGTGEPDLATQAAPLAGGLLALQAVHEAAHASAARCHGLQVSPPTLAPCLPTGCFGGHTPLASYPANRTTLFDFASAGPLVGGACSVAAAVGGLALTSMAPDEAVASMPALSYETLHQSFLFSLLNELALGPPSGLASATEVHLHPLAIVGFTGLISNAVSLLPCGRLDGGRLAVAAYGRQPAAALLHL